MCLVGVSIGVATSFSTEICRPCLHDSSGKLDEVQFAAQTLVLIEMLWIQIPVFSELDQF